jgi:GDP-4-dehydro-6-deoxy-D-mannose reductase
MRAFITGLTGFVGPYLASRLVSEGFEIAGLGIHAPVSRQSNALPRGTGVFSTDIRDYEGLRSLLREWQPDHVYHLAAISNVVTSFSDPRLTYDVNVGGTVNLFESLRELGLTPRIVHVSTAHIYRSVQDGCLDENSEISLLTPYAASKFMSEAVARQSVEGYRFQTMIVRPFNHIGPGQPTGFVCSDFARQIAAIKLRLADAVLHVGNLAAVRDFTDVRDTVAAYFAIAAKGVPGEMYNVSSGSPVSMQDIVSSLCRLAGIQPRIEVDQEKLRSVETLRLHGDSSKIRALGWAPQIPLEQTLSDILDYWIAVLSGTPENAVAPVQSDSCGAGHS